MGNALETPSRWRRFSLMLLNGLTVLLIISVLFPLLIQITEYLNGLLDDLDYFDYSTLENIFHSVKGVLISIFPIIIWLTCDFPVSTRFRGSVGAFLLKLQVSTPSGSRVSILRSMLRFLLKVPIYLLIFWLPIEAGGATVLYPAYIKEALYLLSLIGVMHLLSILISLAWNKPFIDELISGTRTYSFHKQDI